MNVAFLSNKKKIYLDPKNEDIVKNCNILLYS